MDSRLITSGMTEGGLNTSGMTEGGIEYIGNDWKAWGMTEGLLWSLCHARWSLSVIPAGC